jgi:transcriptional regulator with XRE-family HTH domain
VTTSGSSAEEREERLRRALGRVIAMRRAELGLKRNDLRDRSSLSYPYLAELEHGTKRASQSALAAIAEALDLRPSELLERAEALVAGEPVGGSRWFRAPAEPFEIQASSASHFASPVPSFSDEDRLRSIVEEVVRDVVRDELRRAGIEPGAAKRRRSPAPRLRRGGDD